jgi:hypothetical protein
MPEAGMLEPTVVRIEFHDHDVGTRIALSDGPFPVAAREHAEAGYEAALDKLARLLERS